jgi:hypothetical protein
MAKVKACPEPLSSLVRNVPFLTSIEMSLFLADAVGCPASTILPINDNYSLTLRAARSARRRAEGEARPRSWFASERKGIRGGGKVGNLLLVFHFSIRLLPPELWKCGNLALFARFPRNGGKRGNPAFGFPRFPPFRHFHSSFFTVRSSFSAGFVDSLFARGGWPAAVSAAAVGAASA